MYDAKTEQHIDHLIEQFNEVIGLLDDQQARSCQRITWLQRMLFATFSVVVFSISMMVIIMVIMLPQLNEAITTMNRYFGNITDDMEIMRRSMENMQQNVDSLPAIISGIDRIHMDVGAMAADVQVLSGKMSHINTNLGELTGNVNDMRASFQTMDASVQNMVRDVRHMSQPMRMFNSMNPFQ